MTFTPFETARLRLRPQEARDAGFALCIWGDPITGKYLSDPVLVNPPMLEQLGATPRTAYGFHLLAGMVSLCRQT